MKQPYTKQNRSVLLAVVALLFGTLSCSKTEVAELPAAEPEPQQQRIVLTPTRTYEEALTLAQQSIAIVDKPATRLCVRVQSAAPGANASPSLRPVTANRRPTR